MFIEERYEMSDADSVVCTFASSTAVTIVSEDIINVGTGDKDAWGTAKEKDLSGLVWNVSVNTIMAGSGTMTVTLASKAADTSMSSGSTVLATVNFPKESVPGTTRSVILPAGSLVKQYMATLYTNAAATITGSKWDSFLSADVEVI